jgi:DNA-binding transcriptional MerR regulator
MRLAELCAATGVAPATVKYYLREGLLPAGERVSATRAEYGPDHVERLRLIRALVEGADVSIDGIRRIVDAIEHPPSSQQDYFWVAQQAINGATPDVEVTEGTAEAVRRLGWDDCEPMVLAHLQAALDTAAQAGFPVDGDRLVAYGEAMEPVARYDLEALLADPRVQTPSGALQHVAVGTVVTDSVLAALRRLAQQQESERRFAAAPVPSADAAATSAERPESAAMEGARAADSGLST